MGPKNLNLQPIMSDSRHKCPFVKCQKIYSHPKGLREHLKTHGQVVSHQKVSLRYAQPALPQTPVLKRKIEEDLVQSVHQVVKSPKLEEIS